MRKFAWAAFAAVVLLLSATPRPAHADDNNFGVTPEKKLARTLEKLADTCFKCGDIAKGKGLYTYARSYFNYGLMYDPDHRKIRSTMGYKKRHGKWVLEEDMVPLTDKINAARRDELVQKLWKDTEELRKKAAEGLMKYVKDPDLPPAQRMLALYHAVRFDPADRDVLKAARSSPARMWFKHQLDDEADTNRIVWIQSAPKGKKIEEQTPYEKTAGMKLAKRRTDYLVFQADIGEKSEAWVDALSQYGEACLKRIQDLLGSKPPRKPDADDHRLHYTFFSDRARFALFVEKCSGIPDASERKVRAEQSGGTPVYNPPGAVWLYPKLDNDFGLRDGIAHDLGYKEIVRHFGSENYYWLERGFGYALSTQMNGSIHSRFFAVKSTGVIDTGGADALPGFGVSPAGWRLRVAMDVAGGVGLTLSDLVKTRPADYTDHETATAYCMTDYLLHEKKDKLNEFLQNGYKEYVSRYHDKKPPESAEELKKRMLDTLGETEEQFMTGFNAWVVANYIDLKAVEDSK